MVVCIVLILCSDRSILLHFNGSGRVRGDCVYPHFVAATCHSVGNKREVGIVLSSVLKVLGSLGSRMGLCMGISPVFAGAPPVFVMTYPHCEL